MGRSVLIFLRLSMIAGGFAILFLCIRAARAQDIPQSPAPAQKTDPYGYVPLNSSPPDTQPYGIKPIPGYTPPPAGTDTAPPRALRGAYEDAPASGPAYGYVPLTEVQPAVPASAPKAPQTSAPQPAAIPASGTNGDALYGTQMPMDPTAYYQNPNREYRVNPAYRLGPGDKIRVTVFGEADLSGDYQVDGSGMVRLPLIGTLRAKGDTAQALEASITAVLASGYLKQPRVNVEVMTYRPFYIIGAVNRPGEYPYVENMSALNAVGLAGGFTDQAVQGTIYVRHEGSTMEQPIETKDLTRILPGDVIRVRTSLFWQAMNVFTPIAGPAALAAAAFH
jgi:protein involved in polysaccharide export with SLBB domain